MESNALTVSIAYHSGYGHTLKLAEAIAHGATEEGVTVHLINVEEIDTPADPGTDYWAILAASDVIVFGAPTYMGSASGPFKVFQDKTSKVWFTQGWKDKLAGGFTNSASQSGDKLNTLVQFAILAAQHGMIFVNNDLLPGNNSSKGSLDDLNRLGFSLGVAAQSNADEGPDKGPTPSDLRTAEHYGRRLATAAKRWNR